MPADDCRGGRRKNLAFDLLDKDIRKAYLHPARHRLPGLLKRMYRPVFENGRLVAASLGYALTSGTLPLLSVFVVFYLTHLIEAPQVTVRQVLISAGIYAASFLIGTIVSLQLENRHYAWFMNIRMQVVNRCLAQFMAMDYGMYENAAFLDDAGNWGRSLSGNDVGLEGTYHTVFKLGGTVVSALLLGLLLARINPAILLTGLAFIIIFYFSRAHISDYRHRRREALTQVDRRTAHLASEAADFRFGKDVRLFKMQARFAAAFAPLLKAYDGLYRVFTRREFQCSFIESAALVALDAVSFSVLIGQLLAGSITLPIFVMLLTAVTLFGQTMLQLAEQLAFIKDETLYVGDTFDFMDADLQSSGGEQIIEGSGPIDIVFDDVSFHYPGSERMVLEHVNLTFKAGESYALVGVNGAGKTTLVKLLTGMYQPTAGTIRINGVDAAAVPQAALFRLFSAVFQDVQPLALTIAENIAGTDQNIDRARVESCLRLAGLWDKVASLPKGMDSAMLKVIEDDGIILSGGENQKLSLARALYREDSRFMILDEPTAALDALAEEKIYREFGQLLQGRTALFISHRLASTSFCDRIILLDGGRIAQTGTHQALIRQDGLYRHMFITQGKYYQQAAEEVLS